MMLYSSSSYYTFQSQFALPTYKRDRIVQSGHRQFVVNYLLGKLTLLYWEF